MVGVLRDLAADVPPDDAARPGVAGVEDIKLPPGHKYCDPEFVLPDFARISKCAYFDYQRDRVLFRTSPAVKRANRRKKRGGASQRIITSPAAMNRRAISAPVSTVTIMMIAEITHSLTSLWLVSRASLTAAIAIIAITPGPIP